MEVIAYNEKIIINKIPIPYYVGRNVEVWITECYRTKRIKVENSCNTIS